MPFQLKWYIPSQIIYNRFWGEVSEEELYNFYLQSNEMVKSSDRIMVHAITELSGVTKALPFMQVIKVSKQIESPANTGWTITIGEKDPLIRFSSHVTRQLFQVRLRQFDTLNEAITFLKEKDSTLDWAQADQTVLA